MKPNLALIFLFFGIVTASHARGVTKVWEIPFGRGENQISDIQKNMDYTFDFAVHEGKLFVSDVDRNEIKTFDSSGKCIRTIKLPGTPEIVKIWDSTLVVLIDNGQLGLYDLRTKKLNVINLESVAE